jgi:hypothetical protein
MTQLRKGTTVTDIDAAHHNTALTAQGYTICAIESWHDHDTTCILWDAPRITEAELPY